MDVGLLCGYQGLRAGGGAGVSLPRPLLDQPRPPQAPPAAPLPPPGLSWPHSCVPTAAPPGLARPAPNGRAAASGDKCPRPQPHSAPFSGKPWAASPGLLPTCSSRVRPGPSLTVAPSVPDTGPGLCHVGSRAHPTERAFSPRLTAGALSSQLLASAQRQRPVSVAPKDCSLPPGA